MMCGEAMTQSNLMEEDKIYPMWLLFNFDLEKYSNVNS